ncbi:MAG: DUF2510 domain-containing protein [Acidimicrobiales bacterium]|jgi:hypothetical protein
MAGLRKSRKHEGHKQRVLMDGTSVESGPASKPRAYQLPTVNPEPFAPRATPEPGLSADLPLWPGWHPDPTGRHQTRYFDGVSWTDNVVDGKEPSKDPFTA